MLHNNTIRCPKCDYTIRADSDFCIYCNTPIDHITEKHEYASKKTKE